MTRGNLIAIVIALAIACVLPFMVSEYRTFQFTLVLVYSIALLGLNILTGYNGQISLGHGAFYAIGVTLVVLLLLYAFFRFTPLGLAMRAAAQNPESSRLVGIRVGWMLALGWGLAAAIGSIAGMMVAPIVYLDPNMMAGILLYAFAAALIGGIDSPGGAVLGGFLVGVLENVLGAYVVGNELKLVVALVLIIGVLLVKPSGLFGSVQVTRV